MKWPRENVLFLLTWSGMLVGIVVHVYSTFAQTDYVHEYTNSKFDIIIEKIDNVNESSKKQYQEMQVLRQLIWDRFKK